MELGLSTTCEGPYGSGSSTRGVVVGCLLFTDASDTSALAVGETARSEGTLATFDAVGSRGYALFELGD
jgi:hypothetical protein